MKILKIFLLLSSLFIFLNASEHKEHKYKNLEYLDLSKEQIHQFKSVLHKYKNLYEDFHDYEEDQEKRLEEIMENKPFNKGLYIEILNDVKSKSVLLEANQMEEIHQILDDNQRKKFAKYLEDWKDD